MKWHLSACSLVAVMVLSGCGGERLDRAVTGAGIGAASGAVAGALLGPLSIPTGAIVGAGVGAGIGLATRVDQLNLGRPIYK